MLSPFFTATRACSVGEAAGLNKHAHCNLERSLRLRPCNNGKTLAQVSQGPPGAAERSGRGQPPGILGKLRLFVMWYAAILTLHQNRASSFVGAHRLRHGICLELLRAGPEASAFASEMPYCRLQPLRPMMGRPSPRTKQIHMHVGSNTKK